jgi:autotransporter-associated beta strand protein
LDGIPTEGVVWANGVGFNRIGARISGSGGLTKAGTGTLTLTGDNNYTGRTYVSAGTLRVGDGTFPSKLGISGDVAVANGATLALLSPNAINDEAMATPSNSPAPTAALQVWRCLRMTRSSPAMAS